MKQVIDRALELAADDKTTKIDTGHLLLAMVKGHGTASKLLQLRGLTESKIKNQLKELEEEPDNIVRRSIEKARQIAKPFKTGEPSPLHLLAAMASARESRAVKVFKNLGIDAMTIRTHTLRCLTGVTEEHGPSTKTAKQLPDRSEALPVADQLKSVASKAPSEPKIKREPAPISRRHSPGEKLHGQVGLSAKQLIDMGRELERKQRRKRATQKAPKTADAHASAHELTSEPSNEALPSSISTTSNSSASKPMESEENEALDFNLDVSKFPLLSSLGRNLSKEAAENQLDDIIGRTREMERIADVLNKRKANSPCIVGPAGVGKTALVEGLASRLIKGDAPGLRDRVIVEVRPSDLLSGTSVRGALSERLRQLVREVADSNGRIILFFDEFHAILTSSDGVEAIQELKVSLGSGELPCIAATTDEEYTSHVKADQALARRFTPIEVTEPSEEDAIQILKGVEPAYREHHGVVFNEDAIEAAVKLSMRYVNDRALPDKAIALLDLAGARARRENEDEVMTHRVASVLAEQLDVPVERLATTDHERLLSLEEDLAARIIGHKHVLTALGETLRRNAAGFRTKKPIGSFLFLGPTGVGKTETAKALSSFLFPGSNAMVRLDMSEFSEAHAVARLIGAPPGYVGHEEGGQLTEAIRRRSYSLVLLDEIEKAHTDVLKILLQVLDDGRLTDGLGRTVVFENTVIVMTSNLASDLKKFKRQVGFGAKDRTVEEDVSETILSGARESLPPELWNRIDEPLVFQPLSRDEVASIASLMLEEVSKQLEKEHGISLEIGEGAIDALIAAGGYDPDFGARPMKRIIQRQVEGPVARMVLSGSTEDLEIVTILGEEEELKFEINKPEGN